MLGSVKYNGTGIETILAEKGLDSNGKCWHQQLENIKPSDVEKALSDSEGSYNFEKLLILISPAAEDYLEEMAHLSNRLTIKRFGRTIRLYAPLYLSNYCVNTCRYCGFNKENKFERTRLNITQAFEEAHIIASEGFRDILLVSGEDRQFINVDYLTELAGKLRGKFSSISIEIYQMSSADYAKLFEAGIEGVTLYQETYDRNAYTYYHSLGPKSSYDQRLDTPEHIAAVGMREVGLGVLLGLSDWRIETLALAEHAHYLIKRYWQSHISFSFPRLRPAYEVGDLQFGHLLSDKNLVQMITALRLCFADAGLVLSTRERAQLRDHLVKLGITKLSAGSKTNPGGYSGRSEAIEQFVIDDNRSPAEVANMVRKQGYKPIWKDWDRAYLEY